MEKDTENLIYRLCAHIWWRAESHHFQLKSTTISSQSPLYFPNSIPIIPLSSNLEYLTGDRRNRCTSSSLVGAAPEGAAPHRTSSAVPAALLQLDAPADRSGLGPILSWCHRWWHSPASVTRWTLCLLAPQTLGSESRKACTVYSAPVLGPWWSGDDDSVSVRRQVSRRTPEMAVGRILTSSR